MNKKEGSIGLEMKSRPGFLPLLRSAESIIRGRKLANTEAEARAKWRDFRRNRPNTV